MKNFSRLTFLFLTILMSGVLMAKNFDPKIDNIINSEKFTILSKTFNININNLDINNYERTEISKSSHVYRFKVSKNNVKNYLTVIESKSDNLIFIYEKTNLDLHENGFIEQYDEKGNFIADFKVAKLGNGKFSVKINDLFKSDRLGLDSTLLLREDWPACVRRNYKTINDACQASDSCAILCDVSPNCVAYMYAVAAARCTADS